MGVKPATGTQRLLLAANVKEAIVSKTMSIVRLRATYLTPIPEARDVLPVKKGETTNVEPLLIRHKPESAFEVEGKLDRTHVVPLQ